MPLPSEDTTPPVTKIYLVISFPPVKIKMPPFTQGEKEPFFTFPLSGSPNKIIALSEIKSTIIWVRHFSLHRHSCLPDHPYHHTPAFRRGAHQYSHPVLHPMYRSKASAGLRCHCQQDPCPDRMHLPGCCPVLLQTPRHPLPLQVRSYGWSVRLYRRYHPPSTSHAVPTHSPPSAGICRRCRSE